MRILLRHSRLGQAQVPLKTRTSLRRVRNLIWPIQVLSLK